MRCGHPEQVTPVNWHAISTHAWGLAIAASVGAAGGFVAGLRFSPSYHDALRVEYRLRELFCERAIANGLLKTCEVMK